MIMHGYWPCTSLHSWMAVHSQAGSHWSVARRWAWSCSKRCMRSGSILLTNSSSDWLKSGVVYSRVPSTRHCRHRAKTASARVFARRRYTANICCRQLDNWRKLSTFLWWMCFVCVFWQSNNAVHRVRKKVPLYFLPLSLPNANRFSKHRQT